MVDRYAIVNLMGPAPPTMGQSSTGQYVKHADYLALAKLVMECNDARVWLVWSNEHEAWWGPDLCGYYRDIGSAGRYTLEEARACCTTPGGMGRFGDNPDELIQPAPEFFESRNKLLAAAKEADDAQN